MKLIYMGTPDFAVPCLEKILAEGHEVAAVFTQTDKPVGRKQVLTPPPVKVCALSHGLTVCQPKTLRDGEAMAIIREIDPDAIVVAAYGKILPTEMLDYPRYGCLNVHGSLLPRWRGAAPIQWSVISGDCETGVTIMQMNEGIDTGDILMTRAIPIGIDDTAESVFDKLADLGSDMIVDALEKVQKGELTARKQDESAATYAPMLSKENSLIDWKKSSCEVHNLVRGLYSWPIANTFYHGKKLKIYRTELSDMSGDPGEVLALDPLTIGCADGAVIIRELQLEGKKRLDAKTFLIGNRMTVGEIIGE